MPSAADEGLKRQLTPRQIAMMAIGGAIGVGLFLGSTVTIGLAGPGVILTYLLGAAIALVMGYALAEMAVVHPVAGSFGVFAETYLSPWFGFSVRATYAFVQILAIGAEVTAVAIYFAFWFPGVPQWIWVVAIAAALVAVNTARVSVFGEVEYWFALIKVVAILAFIGVGLVMITGLGSRPALGAANLTAGAGGFLPNGWRGVWLALTLVVTSYMGIEGIAVTAGEAENPRESIPRAMRTMVLRLIIFYLLAVSVMLMMTPWRELAEGGGGITGSPFVRAFAAVGVPYAAGAMNVVVISAAVSSANSNLYMTARMLLSLSRSGYAPSWVGAVTSAGVPLRAVGVASAGMVAAILLAVGAPASAFLALYGTAVAGMLYIWVVVLFTYLRFRQMLPPDQLANLPIRMPAHRVGAWLGIAILTAISATTFFVDGLQYSVVGFVPFLAVISIAYGRYNSRMRKTFILSAAIIAASVLAAHAQQKHLNSVIALLEQKKPVFGVYWPSNGGRRGEPVVARPAAELAKEGLAYPKADFLFNGSLEGGLERGWDGVSGFFKAVQEVSGPNRGPFFGLTHTMVLKIPKIDPDRAKAVDNISRELNLGSAGIMFVETESAAEVEAGLKAMRFKSKGGTRPDDVGGAPAYWGMSVEEYKKKADLWPLNPEGELVNWTIVESKEGLKHVREIAAVKGIGVLWPGAGTLRGVFSTTNEKGERVLDQAGWENAIQQVLAACKEFRVPCGFPANANDIEMRMQQGFSVFVMNWGDAGFKTVDLGRKAAGR